MEIVVISIIALILILNTGIVIYLKSGWDKLPFFTPDLKKIPRTKVSVLIAARDEEEKMGRTIDCLLQQNYPKELLEIIIVDDNSTDNTADIIRSYANQGVQLIQLQPGLRLNSYKKKAITEAIQASTGELIITTDADCYMGNNWVRTMVSLFEQNSFKIISGPVAFFEERGMFEKLQSVEFLLLVGVGGAGIGHGMAATCNGANLAYRRDVFFEVGGFTGIDDLASGDDELFLHKVVAKYPGSVGFCKSREAIVHTHAKHTLKEFIQQRKRWASKSTRYKSKAPIVFGVLVWLLNLFIISGLFIGLFYPLMMTLTIAVILAKAAIEYPYIAGMLYFAGRKDLRIYQPLQSFLHIFYFLYIGIAGNTGKYQWKGRTVK